MSNLAHHKYPRALWHRRHGLLNAGGRRAQVRQETLNAFTGQNNASNINTFSSR
jgi:hypothetical protein